MKMNRRDFLTALGLGTCTLHLGCGAANLEWDGLSRTSTHDSHLTGAIAKNSGLSGRIIVVGGGMAGATAAKYLRHWGGSGVDVTLINRDAAYTSSIMSNLVLNGSVPFQNLIYSYSALSRQYGVKFIQGDVTQVDSVQHRLTLANGQVLSYDKLILAPGIAFDIIPGLESAEAQTLIPHAWKAGEQTINLRDQIAALPQGGVYVLTIPAAPYRCPPGPYERACLVADYFKTHNPTAKVIVLDANAKIIAEEKTFSWAFNSLYGGMIEYIPKTDVVSVDARSRVVNTTNGTIRADVLNVIPPNRAGQIIEQAGLNNVGGRWARVNVLSYESTAARNIHVIGDSAATTQPKAGHIANQEAKVCVDAILRSLAGEIPDPQPMTNSACYSPVSATLASWLTAVFAYDPATQTMKNVTGVVEASAPSTKNFKEMKVWFDSLMRETFA